MSRKRKTKTKAKWKAKAKPTTGSRKNGPVKPLERLDAETLRRRRVLEEMERMSTAELVALAVRAGILDENHELTAPYRSDEPSACRPTD